jgi:hypothetical protein
MKLREWLIRIAGVLLCWLWFEFITPRYGDAVRSHYEVNPLVVLAWFIGWGIILGAMFALLHLSNKRAR